LPDCVPNHLNPVQTLTSHMTSILILSSHQLLDLSSDLSPMFASGFRGASILPDVITTVTSGEERYAVFFSLSPATFLLQSAW